jgi:hypothetical protein
VIHSFTNSSRIFAIALAAIVVSIALVSAPAASANSAFALTVTEQSFDIDYGKKISISLKVNTGNGSVDTVRALFKPRGGSTIWAYSYPDFEVENSEVSVSFDIPTGPGSYYPPGSDFDIEIEVTDLEGNKSTVRSPESIEYLDPAQDWQRAQGSGYEIVYYGVSTAEVDEMIESIDHRIPTLEATLGVTDAPDFKAVVFPSIQAATPSFPPVSQTATDQFLFAGFAQPQYRLFVQGQMNSTTFTHELAHLYAEEAVASAFVGGLPAWLNEGLARFLESGSSERSNDRLRSSTRPDELLSLRNMQTIPGQRSDVFIFYPQAGAFVGYLVEEFGHDTMADFLASINDGKTVLGGFEHVYGKPLYEIENDWRARFDAEPLPVPTSTAEASDLANAATATTVPLIDYRKLAVVGANPPSTSTPSTSTPSKLQILPTGTPEDPEPNLLVAGIVIGMSVIIGLWLFTSRRRMPKRKS